ncbi:MAG: outer membrane beta-barrel protein [Planctomycetota bacterium]|jgi:outer membrane protein W
MSILKSLVPIVAVALPASAVAQTTGTANPHSLRATHEIEVSIGLLSALNAGSEVSVGSVEMTSEVTGIIGSIGYNYWFADEWGVTASLGVANADVSTSVSGWDASVESAVVIPLLFGVKYKPLGLAVGDALRPYLVASLGPYFGFASDVRAGTSTGTESYSEMALGARAGVGTDLSLSRRFKLGFTLGYRLVSDFGRRIGSEKNHSSPEFSLSLGIVIGRGKE